jgi:hypothetical protein
MGAKKAGFRIVWFVDPNVGGITGVLSGRGLGTVREWVP